MTNQTAAANDTELQASAKLPASARVVVIGGGAVGCSVLYHLAEMGWTDCVLLEKNELTSGSTWHAAGNCPNFVGSWTMMKMQSYSTELYRKLGDLVDYPMNYHVTGAIRLAHSRQRMEEFRHVQAMGRHMGVEFEEMSNSDMQAIYPFLETHDLYGGQFDPLDGDIDPAQLTQALAKGARDLGAKVIRFCPVTAVEWNGDEWKITTPNGEIRAEYVVNAAGYRAGELGKMFGRDVPCVSLAHQYLITEPIAELTARDEKLPLLRDPDSSYYLRQEKDGLLLGPYEKNCRAHWLSSDDPMPDDFSFQLYNDDLERLEWYIEDACARVPILGTAGITRVVNGPIPYTPDGLPLLGPMPGVPNAFEACVLPLALFRRVALASCLLKSSLKAKPRVTVGLLIRAVLPIMLIPPIPRQKPSKHTAMNMRCISRKFSGQLVANQNVRRFMTGWWLRVPNLAAMADGNALIGSRPMSLTAVRLIVMIVNIGLMRLVMNVVMLRHMLAFSN